MSLWIVQILNGLSFASLLFLLSAGLSLIFGFMRLINLAHGSFYLLGGYIGLTIIGLTGSFWLGLAGAPIAVGLLSIGILRFLLHRFRTNELAQVLVTFGLLLVISDLSITLWGGAPQSIERPDILGGAVALGPIGFPLYRLVLMGVGVVMAVALWLLVERTRIGAVMRAGVDDEEMVRGIGIDVLGVSTAVFALGAALAALSGVLGGVVLGIYPGADTDVLLLAFAVVIVGGLGSLRGAVVGSLFIGVVDTLGKALFPQFALFTVFVPMAIVLAIRPRGLFGRA